MSKLLGVGKALAAVFWALVLVNLIEPFAQPFALLLQLAGIALVSIHGLELWLFADRINRSPQPWKARAQVALFGVFHALALTAEPEPVAQGAPEEMQLEAEHA